MHYEEVIWLIKRNNYNKRAAITLISDFLAIPRKWAEKIYEEEFENE